MDKGVPTLSNPHKLCEKGQILTAEQAQLLKLIGEKMVVFRVRLTARWDASSGNVTQIDSEELQESDVKDENYDADAGTGDNAGDDADDDVDVGVDVEMAD
jgi:mRNA turnover protein 4